MKIVVTGCCGFVGSHITDALIDKGYEVVGIDNLSMGKAKNLAHLEGSSQFTLKEIDVRDEAEVKKASAGCDAIIHLAAYKIPRYGNALETLEVNSLGTRVMLDRARENNARIVIASTSDCYGKNPDVPFSEESSSVFGPSDIKRWSYAVSKLFDEHLAFAYSEAYNVAVTMIRIFGSYGPRHHLSWWGGPQSVFMTAMLSGEPIQIHGDGLQTRSFTYISDLVNGFMLALESDKAVNQVFNIGSTEEITIKGLAEVIHKVIGAEGEPNIEYIPYTSFSGRYEDVRRRVPDISKAGEMLGFKPQVSLEEGLIMTLPWHTEAIRNAVKI